MWADGNGVQTNAVLAKTQLDILVQRELIQPEAASAHAGLIRDQRDGVTRRANANFGCPVRELPVFPAVDRPLVHVQRPIPIQDDHCSRQKSMTLR